MMKKVLLSAIAIFAMTLCSFAQMQVCTDACAPHATAADYSTGVIPTYPQTFPTLTVGQEVDECVSIQIPTEINGGSIISYLSDVTITINSVTVNELVNLPAGLTVCASENPMAADGTYTLHITGAPTTAGTYALKMKASIDGTSSSQWIGMTVVNGYTNGTNGVSTGITINVVEEGAITASFTTNPAPSTDYESLDFTQAVRVNEGGSVAFTSTSMAHHIAWTFEGGSPATSTLDQVSVSYATAGTYTATLIAFSEDNQTTDTATVTVKVSRDPATVVTASITSDPAVSGFLSQSVTIEQGQTVSYTNASTNAHHVAWSFPGGNPATSTEATEAVVVTYNTVGTFTTQLVAYSEDNQTTDTATLTINVNASAENAVTADFTTNPAATDLYVISYISINQGETVTFTSACSANTHHFAWSFGEGASPATSTANEVTVTYAEAGTYTATLTAYNEDETISNSKSVTVRVAAVDPDAVVADFTTDPAYIDLYIYRMLTVETGTTVTYTSACNANTDHVAWTFEGGSPATSTANEVSVTYAEAGTFTTQLVAYNSDATVTDTITLTVMVADPTSVEESAISAISVYPNPANEMFTVANAEGATIVVVNSLGQVVANIENADANQTIDASNFANGTYFVKVNAEVIKINVVK